MGIDSNGQWRYVNGEGVGTDLVAALNITDTTGAQSYINGNSTEVGCQMDDALGDGLSHVKARMTQRLMAVASREAL